MSRVEDLFADAEEPGKTPAETAADAGDTTHAAETAAGAQPPVRGKRLSFRRRTSPAVMPETVAGNPEYPGPIVELEDVTRFFPGPPPVNALRGVDLAVQRGDYLAIVGPSGSGKSTMLNTLGLLDRPSTGRFLFEGIDVASLSDDERSALRGRAVGFVFQSFHLMPTRSTLENVMLAGTYAGLTRDEREPLARAALDRVGLGHRVDASPTTLSGGERQRVAIARAVCTSPRLLLADEPTGNLDRANSESIMRLFSELGEDGLTIVMITHDAAVAAAAERRVRINDGELSELA
ncbi:putative ABC transport system ATP-binding protein [Leucobacter luti]|uniref:Putative ABC transport system ATP-binding protein n=2 Tax=Leucobacter luti TaxID=340320 RepID=A0A4R6S6J6_9MICO|nr:putative ABC transport system ATP-binding protein [Leucobacter luti]